MYLLPTETPASRVDVLQDLARMPDEGWDFIVTTIAQIETGGFAPRAREALKRMQEDIQQYLGRKV